ncbi:hypothetical protein [Variovorax arabinosiphilus]|uniref:hypothetical protein n=1 Tax=Variovorax arabinosiphilus TaxID=3053498 RepID=UPI002575B404|nr:MULTISPECIES: hypothetical protein [unclassified Variovorax]MDM0122191.1 hypothetical protein [Variovorax sp. J2L1-78]MDM0131280.1 hypothetical protein [Variovorax sp. J2L1-63]MDM0234954.1 hypothetical protein [Variovorax sp. J2R1-6]
MEGASLETVGMRRAALLLHAMAPVDQAFMLQALSGAQAEALRRLVDELDALGIAPDASLIAEATSTGLGQRGDATASSSDEWNPGVVGEVDAMVRLLSAEPTAVIACWLNLTDGARRERVLAGLEPAQRRRVEAFASEQPARAVPPALRAALHSAVVDALRVAQQSPQTEPKVRHAAPKWARAIDAIRAGQWLRRRTRS